MSNKFNIIIYMLSMLACFYNAYLAYKINNVEATIAWVVAAGLAGGASGAYFKLKDLENDNEK